MSEASTTGNTGKVKWVVISIIAGAMLLRLVLGLLNRDANDNHVEVVNLIISSHKLPDKNDCGLCYQPKLYYVACSALVKALNITDFFARVEAMQLVNVFFSFFILIIFWKFIDKQNMTEKDKYLVFAFFAFNPSLTGINIQGTNDTPVIFFGILSTFAAVSFFDKLKTVPGVVMILALVAGMLTKASAIVLTGVICVVFVIKLIAGSEKAMRVKAAKYFAALLLITVTLVPFVGGYYHNYKQYGSFTLSCWEKDAPAHFFQKTWVERPGLRSISDGFFTFRYFDMIRQPYINKDSVNYPEHRTSLWSQIYGRVVFMHFDQWPVSWQTTAPLIITIGRILIIIGIVPLLLFCAGLAGKVYEFTTKLLEKDWSYFSVTGNYIYLLITLAFLASSVYYTYSYRDFASMKSIYIFPGLLAFIKIFIEGYTWFNSKITRSVVTAVLSAMIVLSICDSLFLVYQLYR